jgi:hypothetical protein
VLAWHCSAITGAWKHWTMQSSMRRSLSHLRVAIHDVTTNVAPFCNDSKPQCLHDVTLRARL